MIERWIRPPRLRIIQDQAADRRATWLELFFDLVFAAAVADIGSRLSTDYTLLGLGRFGFQFLLVWWAWIGHTYFSTRFDNDDPLHRFLTLGQVFLAAVMSVNASADLGSREAAGFVAAYGGVRLLLAVQYGRVTSIPATRRFAWSQALLVALGAFAWIGSGVVAPSWRVWLWSVALLIDLGTPFLARRLTASPPIDPTHMVERFGLFTLILFGQSVVAVMAGMRHRDVWTPGAAMSAILGLALAFALWWAYFDLLVAANPRSSPRWFPAWAATHLPLCFGIAVAAVGVEHAVARDGSIPLGSGAPFLVSGIAIVVLALGVLTITTPGVLVQRPAATIGRYFGLGLLMVPLVILGSGLMPVWLLGWLLGFGIAVNLMTTAPDPNIS